MPARSCLNAILFFVFVSVLGGTNLLCADVVNIDASLRPAAVSMDGFHMGTQSAPGGHTLAISNQSLVRDGQPWLPISGEFHFSRCPESEWRDELLKMKAGGVSIVASYIFWIHHEEVEGTWDWSGQRNLHQFLQTCKDVGLDVQLRIGPWCHGEVRNGGFPDWLQKKGDDKVFELRRDNPGYLAYVKTLYEQIAQQTQGMLWKDGGPVIGIQVENEYSGPTQHLLTLKRMAIDAGINVPIYSCTGWGSGGAAPYGEILPFSGAYAEGFWDRSIMPGGYGGVLRFSGSRRGNAAAMGAMGGAATTAVAEPARPGSYPFFTCELGGGMMASYHRRVFMYPEDAESLVLTRLGSGVNLLGIYMYHGGENPDGKLTYLNETQATNYWNDLPVKNYDFQAPIGQYGQEREHYHWLRLLGLFLNDYGPALAGMSPRNPRGQNVPNCAVRSDGTSAYLFMSNYQRLAPQGVRENLQFQIKLAGGDVKVPSEAVTIPDNCRFFWPVNIDLGGIKLVEASAQPICQVDDGVTRYSVFRQTAAVRAEFAFDATTATLDSTNGQATTENRQIVVRNVLPGTGAAIRLHSNEGKNHVILLLDEATSMQLWKGSFQGQNRLFLTKAALMLDGGALRLRTEDADCSVAILPAPATLKSAGKDVLAADDGLFRRFSPTLASAPPLTASIEQIRQAGPARTVPIAPSVPARKQGVAMQPEDSDFAQAGVWRITFPAGVDPARSLRLRVEYTGDVARAYLGDRLLNDDFYSGRSFDIGLSRYGPTALQNGITLKILPVKEDAPVYFTDRSKLKFNDDHVALGVNSVDVVESREVRLDPER